MADRPTRTHAERVAALEHVGFELYGLASASHLLAQALSRKSGLEANAFLESALLHARSLIDFFLNESRHPSDIRRTDFAREWEPVPADAVERLREKYPLLHKYLAHLTWERVEEDSPAWDYPGIASDVIAVSAAWSDHLLSVDRVAWEVFRPYVFNAQTVMSAGLQDS